MTSWSAIHEVLAYENDWFPDTCSDDCDLLAYEREWFPDLCSDDQSCKDDLASTVLTTERLQQHQSFDPQSVTNGAVPAHSTELDEALEARCFAAQAGQRSPGRAGQRRRKATGGGAIHFKKR